MYACVIADVQSLNSWTVCARFLTTSILRTASLTLIVYHAVVIAQFYSVIQNPDQSNHCSDSARTM
jgi:hypothetical protein